MFHKKCIVLFSGGLDSRLVVKIMQERGFAPKGVPRETSNPLKGTSEVSTEGKVVALHFNLPFGCGCCDFGCNFNFTQMSGVKFKIFDCSSGKLLEEYLDVLKKGEHGRGAGFNPCIDCKIFMFKKAIEFARKNKIEVIATGEVSGQRPMSQTPKAMKIIDKEVGFELVRPLMELGISGRSRGKQMELAEEYKIKYPTPAGGCSLCEKALKKRFKVLIKGDLIDDKTLKLVNIGRHFFKDFCWFVVGRNEKENLVIETFRDCIKSGKGKPAVYYSKEKGKYFAEELQEDYKTGGKKKQGGERL